MARRDSETQSPPPPRLSASAGDSPPDNGPRRPGDAEIQPPSSPRLSGRLLPMTQKTFLEPFNLFANALAELTNQ